MRVIEPKNNMNHCVEHLTEPDRSADSTLGSVESARVLVVACAYNEASKIGSVLEQLGAVDGIDVLVIDDASSDETPRLIRQNGVAVIHNDRRKGVGSCIRSAIRYFLDRPYEILVFIAGNNKDRPSEIPRLVDPVVYGKSDLVQGSRFLPGGHTGNMPFWRRVATRHMHPWLFKRATGQHMTDTTNGFRAIHRRVLEDPQLRLEQPWLDRYELEPYLLAMAIRLGYRVVEVPVSKTYPPHELGYTKMKPITDWWRIIRPLLFFAAERFTLAFDRMRLRRDPAGLRERPS